MSTNTKTATATCCKKLHSQVRRFLKLGGTHGAMGAACFLHLILLRRLLLALLRPAFTPSTHQVQRLRPIITCQLTGKNQTDPPL